jgi:acyl-coenzyme A thioesterase PaaI-like protein
MAVDDHGLNSGPPTEAWAHLDHRDPGSDLFADLSPEGVLLCRSCGARSRCRLGLHREELMNDGSVRSELACPADHEGGPRVAHGGWTAGVLDEMSGHALLMRDEFAVTGELVVKFVKPVPIERALIGTVRIAERDGRRVHVRGELRLSGADEVLATSHALMIRRPGDHFLRHQKWLASLEFGEEVDDSR